MKFLPLFFVMISSSAFADGIPKGAFKSSEFEKAREVAKIQGKALIYIETDSKSTCPKTQWATGEAYSELKRDYVLVVEDDADPDCVDVKALYAAIKQTTKIGNTTPRVTVVEPENLEFITGTDYRNMAADKRWAKKLDEAVGAKSKPVEGTESAVAEAPVAKDWTNTEGKTIHATFVELKSDIVVLKLETGKTVEYPISKLSEGSKRLLPAAK